MADLGSVDIGAGKGLQFSIRLPGAQGFTVALSRFGDQISDFTEFWESKFKTWWYAGRQTDYVKAGFDAPLSPAYQRWKNQHFPNAPILVLSGRMKASLLGPGADGSVWRPGPRSLEVGSEVPYAIYHQVGTHRMPARPPLRFTSTDAPNVGKLLQAYVVEAWKARRAAERAA